MTSDGTVRDLKADQNLRQQAADVEAALAEVGPSDTTASGLVLGDRGVRPTVWTADGTLEKKLLADTRMPRDAAQWALIAPGDLGLLTTTARVQMMHLCRRFLWERVARSFRSW